ncbi:MAG: nucleotidyltransferase domain-containing protein [Candidatus Pacearchaeota archaeon]|nr:nucleotidyltransferase domain-containing protein [Candidatus Pacearchaeota archaeon]
MKTDSKRKSEDKKEENSEMQEIPGMDLDNNYSGKKPLLPEGTEKLQKEMEKTKKEFDKIKALIVKKYPFVQAIGILAPQAIKLFVEDEIGENIPPEELQKLQKKNHLYVIIPEEKFKEIPKIKKEMIAEIDKIKKEVWLYIKTPVDIWEACLDSKFEMVSAIGMSYPLYDTGILESLRVAEIHKALVLQKFDKYIVSYVIAGSMVRGDVTKESDVDVFIIINDTDVKRMPRLELKERLRSMIFQYISEATALAGAKKNILNVQPYLLTDFWESVKDAHPVIFTFIRDGVPLYDRGTFLPWKALLKMGRLKPSPEAIDMFMSMGDKTVKRAKAAMLDILVHDVYWSVLTPSQALLMLYGLAPPTPKQTAGEMKRIFVDKEKMLEKKYITILENIIQAYKDFEHEKLKEIKGAELDKMLDDTEDYLKRLEELRKQIEKRSQEKTVEQIHKDIFDLLEAIFGKKSQAETVSDFEKLVKEGKFTQNHLKILYDVITAKTEFKKGHLDARKVDNARKNASILINDLIEYSQRSDLMAMEKARMVLKYEKDGKPARAELLHCNGVSFLFEGEIIKKITDKIEPSNMKEVSECMANQKLSKTLEINPKVFELVKKELGNFEIVL